MPSPARIMLIILAAALLLPAALARQPQAAPRAAHPGLKPLVSLSGPDSRVMEPRHELIRTQKAFDAMWTEHKGDAVTKAVQGWPQTPQIDFEKCVVLAIFSGPDTNCNGHFIVEMAERPADLLVRFDSITFQTMETEPGVEDRGVATVPYGIFVLPRTDKPVALEENTQNLIRGDPVWTDRGRLE